jgi:hypothetical protein
MPATTQSQDLEEMRLPDLWHLFRQVRGEPTRCPNRPFLIRKIREVLDGAPVITIADDPVPTGAPGTIAEEESTSEGVEALEGDAHTSEAQASDEAEVGETSTSEPTDEADEGASGIEGEAKSEPPSAALQVEPRVRGRFASMTVEELQVMYRDVVGRPTSSLDKAYLTWKIRQAEKGRVPVGPTRRRAVEAEPVEFKVLPLRFTATSVAMMDAVWRALSMRSRSDFVRTAIDAYIKGLADGTAVVPNREV